MMKLWINENHICELRSEELYEGRSPQLCTQLLQLQKESLKKKFRLVRDSNRWPPRYRCSALRWSSFIEFFTPLFTYMIFICHVINSGLSCFQGTSTSYLSPSNLIDSFTLSKAIFSLGESGCSTCGVIPIASRLQNCFSKYFRPPSLHSDRCMR